MQKLSPKQEAFCLAYVKSGNATQAYKEAGYRIRSDNSAAAAATRMLRNVKVKSRIDELTKQTASPKIMDATEAQEFLTTIARGKYKDVYLLQNGQRLIKPVPLTVRLQAIDKLLRAQGAYLEKREVNMAGGVVVIRDDINELDE